MSDHKPPEDMIGEVHQALRNLRGRARRNRAKLEGLKWLKSSCLVQTYLLRHKGQGYRHALKAVLTRALDEMEREALLYAQLLRLRFWEGFTVKKIVSLSKKSLANSQFTSERQVHALQVEAIGLFADTLWESETRCIEGQYPGPPETERSNEYNRDSISPGDLGPDDRFDFELPPSRPSDRRLEVLSTAPRGLEPEGPYDPFDFEVPPSKPTQRQLEVLIATGLGLKPNEVGALFFISSSTVNTHLSEIRSAFNMRTTLEAFVYAQHQGWITSDDMNAMRARIRKWQESKLNRQ